MNVIGYILFRCRCCCFPRSGGDCRRLDIVDPVILTALPGAVGDQWMMQKAFLLLLLVRYTFAGYIAGRPGRSVRARAVPWATMCLRVR